MKDLMNHKWFREFNWPNLRKKDYLDPVISYDDDIIRYNNDVIPQSDKPISITIPEEKFKEYNYKDIPDSVLEGNLSDLVKTTCVSSEFYPGGMNPI